MKSILLCVISIRLLSSVFAVYPPRSPKPIDLQRATRKTELQLKCADETGVSPDEILSVRKGVWHHHIPELKAWVQCVLFRADLMTDQSVLRQDVAFRNLTDIEKPTIEANIDKCLPTTVMLPIDISWYFAKCYQKQDPDHSLF